MAIVTACESKPDYWDNTKRTSFYLWRNNKQEGQWTVRSKFNCKIDGTYIEFYDNGKQKTYTTYKSGKRTGIYIGYYFNGHTKTIKQYKNGKKQGKACYYYSTGILKQKEYYKKGIRNGMALFNYPNGKLNKRGPIKNGLFDGTWKSYELDGSSHVVVVYRQDTLLYSRCDTMIDKTKYISINEFEFVTED